ncbi:MAG: dihydropteroate synthase [Rhodospirillales bacterium]|nr:dihydropteroate synthase [Rhodospirillales bacterium]
MAIAGLNIIGERINPGFQSTKAMFDNSDLVAIQELAIKQADAGAVALNINIGTRALDEPEFMIEVIEVIQAKVDIPLSFDFPNVAVQEICLKKYDAAKAQGRKPIVNSICETRWDMLDLLKIQPFRMILMASERVEDGAGLQNKNSADMLMTTQRMTKAILGGDYGVEIDDLIVDISIGTLSSDTEGLTRMSLEAIRLIHEDPDLAGIHMSGGLSNLSVQLPAKPIDGAPLKLQLENAYLTRAIPYGFDHVLGTPWRDYYLLDEDNKVLKGFDEITALDGLDALRRLRKLYKD